MKNLIKNLKMFLYKNTNLNNTNGITLIALVITIIVLLILAGVTIATLIGDNGILAKTQQAKTETEESKEDELRKLTALEASTNLENHPYTDKNGDTATIPAGFAVSQVEGENIIDDGLVVIDSNGNEFVWVPVSNYAEFVRREGYYDGNEQTYLQFCGESDSTGQNTNNEIEESETTKKESQEMYTSIQKNAGFYIGRYESGKDNAGNVIIQKGATVYNNIPWSRNGQMNEESKEIAGELDGTKDGAIELSRNFDTFNNYTNVTSTLIYSVQWDAIMKWMENIPNINAEGKTYIQDSTGMGWYSDNSQSTIHLTGISVDNKKSNCVNNIYDLAGNLYEWTMESYNTNKRIRRGGVHDVLGSQYPVSYRSNSCEPFANSNNMGFRITLYIN